MTAINIVRTREELPSEDDKEAVKRFLFGCINGVGGADRKSWNKMWRKVLNLEPGEMIKFDVVFPRNPYFHRKFFAMLNIGFDAWEPNRKNKTYKGKPVAKSLDAFREDVLILAGFYTQTFGLDGKLQLKAKSISFAKMDEVQFEEVYSAVANVILEKVLTSYKGREELDEVVERVLGFL
jgi:hypothetical protein